VEQEDGTILVDVRLDVEELEKYPGHQISEGNSNRRFIVTLWEKYRRE